jgi:hypothetical protein
MFKTGDLVTCPSMPYMGTMTIINVIEKQKPEYVAKGLKPALVQGSALVFSLVKPPTKLEQLSLF